MTAQVLSYGGGRQTVAMCLLILHGKLPRPDYIIAADTGREAQSTWDYLNEHIQPMMTAIGLPIHIAPHSLSSVDLYAHNGDLLLPVFTQTGKLSTYCSNEWKARVSQRYMRQELRLSSAVNWIGFALDEKKRIKITPEDEKGPWYRSYPLVDRMITKADCIRVIEDAGLPVPQKSACYMCPHRSNEEWRVIRDLYPQQWQQAIAIDEEIRANDERGGVWLHQSRVPLKDADLDIVDRGIEGRQCGLWNCWS
jgi:hypothetical protein